MSVGNPAAMRQLPFRSDGKAKVMVSGGMTKDGVSKSNVDPCGVCSLRVKPNSLLCLQCDEWIHGRCARVKRVTPKFSRNFVCIRCKMERQWSRKKSYVMN